ncbi:MAG: SMC-Scp complex subunit ScpB [Chloroflexi bacterium AL-W]|nr:SMC-Scp complex subunit ScpB [Chloroflexi bacterium AL-N1]NOK69104.1 SMC-Scp complex subunit ScpB [Chloroflexi bacterium AL-N10]NOK77087.1 SMC-Scp complex subunit ScpB [Chloroflexi bacterium AL-N5]NOK83732.1 SMC-Scp complex subunit ScpB [Chloroflexi bacterium AL-W]NOK90942.1 SMC-Scp complex subunit ScpB [Chloroflexi bacterium AL-N15]
MEQSSLISLPPLPDPTLVQMLESVLFVAGESVTIAHLAKTLEVMPDAVEAALEILSTACADRGIRVQRSGDRIQLVSAPETALVIERFLGIQASTRLSTAALETLAIVAYRQPITRAQVEAVRGVDSSGVVRVLLSRALIAEVGRLETVGRPLLYATTEEFLRQFGLANLEALPSIEWPELLNESLTVRENEV